MNADDLQALGQALAFLALGGYTAWQSRRSKNEAKAAKEYAKPTGNGFAQTVKDSLARIESRSERTEKVLLDHIQAHADADIKRGA
ncbi:hypothetical protein [Kribbella deserti]|uniref:Uncharacterized protein n=1 Tax=Kribbella deserti TaxID=1926257 RepID=A0ABV6QY73_9ACTN